MLIEGLQSLGLIIVGEMPIHHGVVAQLDVFLVGFCWDQGLLAVVGVWHNSDELALLLSGQVT